MEGRSRFLRALSLGQPDQVPMFDEFSAESVVAVGEKLGYGVPPSRNPLDYSPEEETWLLDLLTRIIRRLDMDAASLSLSTGIRRVAGRDDLAVDSLGIVYRPSDHGDAVPVEGPIRTLSDVDEHAGLLAAGRDSERLSYLRRELPDRALVFCVPDPFDLSWSLLGGLEKLLLRYVVEPELCLRLAQRCAEYIVDEARLAIAAGIDVLVVAGDLASRDNLLMSPDHYRKYVKSHEAAIVGAAHASSIPVIKHSDGDIGAILDDLIDIGFDGVHPVQPQSMDIGDVKRRFGDRVCIVGNIDCAFLLPFGSEADVERAVEETIAAASREGGYILSSSNSIHPRCRPENVIAMFNACRTHGRYRE
jgi:uroporphyrinogen decarboxylase